ncbi:MAG: hypothetical protein GF350_05515 [Chitinivibrionales bacterium]|nr:hypothetical protein [Chitinivibrionales bacterium]
MKITSKDRTILRTLAEKQAAIASLPVQKERAAHWSRLNGLKKGRPMVWINEIPWHEMDVNNELALQCEDEFCRTVEKKMRRTLYTWEHMPADMVVEPKFYSPLVISDTGFGIQGDTAIAPSATIEGITSHEFHPQIKDESDIENIKFPRISLDREASDRNYQALVECFGDICAIEQVGIHHFWFAPWDELVTWWGVQEALTDLLMCPDLVHAAMDRLVTAHCERLRQWEELDVLSSIDGNYRVGSGGLAYCDEIPGKEFDQDHVATADQWGCSAAQIFVSVSPEMHEEFALQYERRWLERFGLTYYGCCEPLHDKIHILKTIPNLRKISISPWADAEKAAERIGADYVISCKPNPAVFAEDAWNPVQAKKDLETVMEKLSGCIVEVIMKDISTVRNEPQRLWEWAQIATDVAGKYS